MIDLLSICSVVRRKEAGRHIQAFFALCRVLERRRGGVVSLIERWDAIDERVINFVGPELVAREDFVEKIRNLAAPELDYGFSEPEGDFFVNRPRIINVSSARFEKLLGRRPRSLGEAINLELSN